MTIDEIQACEIPAGKYKEGLQLLKNEAETYCLDDYKQGTWKTRMDSLFASFEALLALAKGNCVLCTKDFLDSSRDKVTDWDSSYDKAVAEVLAVVDGLNIYGIENWQANPEDIQLELKARIEKLKESK